MIEREERQPREGGYVLVLFVSFLFVMLVMAAFAIDIGAWQSRGGQIQRAADAASLAGVVHMPDITKAREVALEAAAKNGFVDNDATQNPAKDIDVIVQTVTGNTRRLRVGIIDRSVGSFFANVFMNDIKIARSAVGHYAEPIPLGSTKNHFGIESQNFYAAINGRCAAAEDGDLLASQYDGNARPPVGGASRYQCAGDLNPDYDRDGYVYNIQFDQPPAPGNYPIRVQVWDPAFNPQELFLPPSGTSPDYSLDGAWNGTPGWNVDTTALDTTYELRKPDVTPGAYDGPVINAATFGTTKNMASNWVTIGTINSADLASVSEYPARFRLRVKTDATRPNSWGVNLFSIRAVGPSGSECDTLTDVACPSVSGEDRMSLWVNKPGTMAEVFLARVEDAHAGKRLRVELWDPGEGGQRIEIWKPAASAGWERATFSWAANGFSGGTNVDRLDLDVGWDPVRNRCTVDWPQPGTNRQGNCKFNDRKVTIYIDIPTSYRTTADTKGWWKIRYHAHGGGEVQDRTTWRIIVEGDPVRLVQE